jgi:hypothetical protein
MCKAIYLLLKLVAKQSFPLQLGRPLVFVAHSLGGEWDFKIGCYLVVAVS